MSTKPLKAKTLSGTRPTTPCQGKVNILDCHWDRRAPIEATGTNCLRQHFPFVVHLPFVCPESLTNVEVIQKLTRGSIRISLFLLYLTVLFFSKRASSLIQLSELQPYQALQSSCHMFRALACHIALAHCILVSFGNIPGSVMVPQSLPLRTPQGRVPL